MDNEVCIRVDTVSKEFQTWATPTDRIKAPILQWISKSRWLPKSLEAAFAKSATSCFHKFRALSGVSFEVRKGESVGVLGYNGSGKSTLLQIIAGTLTPTSGSVTVDGRVAALLELGSGFNPDFTGRENVYLYGSILGFSKSEIDHRFSGIEDFAEIGAFINEPIRSYSSGMVVRLAFAVITQLDPDIVIIDEALAVGDAYFQHKSMQRTRSLRTAGKSILLVTHDTVTIKSMCDRAIILEKGRVIRDGPAESVADYYLAMVAKKTRDSEIRQFSTASGRVATRSGNGLAQISRCEMFAANGAPSRVFDVHEIGLVACTVKFDAPVTNPTIGFLIRDRLGNPVFGTNTYHLKLAPRTYERGEEPEFAFEFPMLLGPGSYSLTAAVHAGDSHLIENYDWFDNAVVFEVHPGSEPRSAGCAYLPVKVTSNPVPSLTRRLYSPGTVLVFSSESADTRHLGAGWSLPEQTATWSDGGRAELVFEIPDRPCRRTVTFSLHPFLAGGIASQRMCVTLNDNELGTLTADRAGDYVLSVEDHKQPSDGNWLLAISLPDACSPADRGVSSDQRKLGIALRRLIIA